MLKTSKAIAVVYFVGFLLLFVFQGEPSVADPPTGEDMMHPLLALLLGGLFLLWLHTSVALTLYGVLASLESWADRKVRGGHLVTAGLALPGIIYLIHLAIADVQRHCAEFFL